MKHRFFENFQMGTLKIVLLTDADSLNQRESLPYKYHGQKLWDLVRRIVERLKYRCESVDLHKLDFQEEESVNKYLNADIVMMVRIFQVFLQVEGEHSCPTRM